jgi:hypothetical protein
MFSIFKKVSTEQDVVLQDLTEEQLAQAAGGRSHNDHDWDDRKKWTHRHHHHHHHHHHMMTPTKWTNTQTTTHTNTVFGGTQSHW